MLMHPHDEQTVQSLLGVEAVPAALYAECALRLSMYHRAGHSGPLGALGLIPAVRALGYGPPADKPDPTRVQWDTLPTDGRVRVEAMFAGIWHAGEFVGLGLDGTLHVRLVARDEVFEVRPHRLRLVQVLSPEEIARAREEAALPGAAAAQPEGPPTDVVTVDPPPVADRLAALIPEPEPESPEGPEPPPKPKRTNWLLVPDGSPVFVGEEYRDGTFRGCAVEQGRVKALRVLMAGQEEPVELDPRTVEYAGEQPGCRD